MTPAPLLDNTRHNGDKPRLRCASPRDGVNLINILTGELKVARCGRWSCPLCGRIHVMQWCARIVLARPVRFITLTAAGETPTAATENLKYCVKIVRRADYPFEYLAVLERASKDGLLHWHILQHGRDWLSMAERGNVPREVLSDAAQRAGMGSVVDVRFIRGSADVRSLSIMRSFGYNTKSLINGDLWKGDNVKRRRVRYSRDFFPQTTKELDKIIRRERGDIGTWKAIRSKPKNNDVPTP